MAKLTDNWEMTEILTDNWESSTPFKIFWYDWYQLPHRPECILVVENLRIQICGFLQF